MSYSQEAMRVGALIYQIRIQHTKFKETLDSVGRIIQLGNQFREPYGVSVIAPAGAGKTFLIDCIKRNVCSWPFLRPNGVIVASLKEAPAVGQIQDALLASFKYAIPPRRPSRSNNGILFDLLAETIEQHNIQLIALDEYGHVFPSRKYDEDLIDWTKRLMTRTKRPMLLAGTDALRAIEKADSQLSSRVPTILTLPAFVNDEAWRGLLAAFATNVPDIDLSSLPATHFTAMHKATEGSMRQLKSLLVEATMIAIDSGRRKVEASDLKFAFQRIFGTDSSRTNPFK